MFLTFARTLKLWATKTEKHVVSQQAVFLKNCK